MVVLECKKACEVELSGEMLIIKMQIILEILGVFFIKIRLLLMYKKRHLTQCFSNILQYCTVHQKLFKTKSNSQANSESFHIL